MWYISILLGLIFSGVQTSNVDEELGICEKNAGAENVHDLDDLIFDVEFVWTLESLCPRVLGFMGCVDAVIQKHMGSSMAELQKFPRNPQMLKGATIFNHIRDVFRDVCMEGSDLNNVYKSNEECFDTMELDPDMCVEDAFNFYSRNVTGSRPENATPEKLQRNKDCLLAGYISACFATKIHENCGADAFALYQTMVKRSSIFSVGICSEEGLDLLKTLVLDAMEQVEEPNLNLFRLAFDLRKRRK